MWKKLDDWLLSWEVHWVRRNLNKRALADDMPHSELRLKKLKSVILYFGVLAAVTSVTALLLATGQWILLGIHFAVLLGVPTYRTVSISFYHSQAWDMVYPEFREKLR